jgi:hypothetical protein
MASVGHHGSASRPPTKNAFAITRHLPQYNFRTPQVSLGLNTVDIKPLILLEVYWPSLTYGAISTWSRVLQKCLLYSVSEDSAAKENSLD